MTRKLLLLCGVVAPIVYVTAVIIGGLLRPTYNHLAEPVSELTAAGAPNKGLLDVMFLAYNALVMLFGVGVMQKAARTRGRFAGVAAGLSLMATGLCGVLLQLFFPQDPGGAQAAVTETGKLHIVFAGLAALASMLAAVAAALWFRRQPNMSGYSRYSVVTLLVMLVSGGAGAAAASSGATLGGLFGLVERITIGSLILWLFVVGRKLFSGEARERQTVDTVTVADSPARR